jgi:hypothetical protein
MISDQTEYGIGEVILGTPPAFEGAKPLSSPSMIFGMKHRILSKIIAERCSVKFNVPCLILLNITQSNTRPEIQTKTVVDCLNQAIDAIKDSS